VILLPLLIVGLAVALSIPLGLYMARMMDRPTSGPIEELIDTGQQEWKRYCFEMLAFNAAAFLIGFLVLATQQWHPGFLNPENKGALAPSTIFNTVCSFLTNTNLQHYSGEVHLSYGSVLFFTTWKNFITPAIGLAALMAVIRGLRGDEHLGNFLVDTWRGVVWVLLPLSLIVAVLLLADGVPMTMEGAATATPLEKADDKSVADKDKQKIARGPVAALIAIKQLGTNGGGFFGPNSAHPLENPTAFTNIVECLCIILIPMACVIMFGVMIRNMQHAALIYGVMMLFLVGFLVWAIWADTAQPNPAFGEAVAATSTEDNPEELPALPVDQSRGGNLEGKELRFGPSAGATWSIITTCTSNGSVNCMHDSMLPMASVPVLSGMWLNCNFGGIGVGLINMLVYLIVAVFLSGLMVGRTPEYLGRKVEAREMKLAMLAMLIHPLMILGPLALFAAMGWSAESANNPGPHGLSESLYEFTSASANNGSGFEGLADTHGFWETPEGAQPPAKYAFHWDVACGLVMLMSRFVPIIAPIALAAGLAAKRPTPFTVGTLRTDTITFGFVLLGTILLIGALLFLPVAALGPIAEHFGPVPFHARTP
jgi:K+-transporting ATPase ATPase A chain